MYKKKIIFLILIVILVVLFLKKKENFNNYTNLNQAENVIMTTYFCKKEDPQRPKTAPCNDIKYVESDPRNLICNNSLIIIANTIKIYNMSRLSYFP